MGIKMTFEQLCELLQLPSEVTESLKNDNNVEKIISDETIRNELNRRDSWDSAICEIRKRIGDDPSGFHILNVLLHCACDTWKHYQEKSIHISVFADTMKFCTRFLYEHKKTYGTYAFTWAWWFPRQLAMQEFRIGELEYELIPSDSKRIYIHIPSDACMEPSAIQASFHSFREFLNKYFPDWSGTDWYCESWMLSPALSELLPEHSNLIHFQNMFDLVSVDYESMAVLDWVFPGETPELDKLPENTTLQRNLKKFLLSGKKFGWAEGKLC